MRRDGVLSVVLQATVLFMVSFITNSHIVRNWNTNIWDDPVVQNFTTSLKVGSDLQTGAPHGFDANATLTNATLDKSNQEEDKANIYLALLQSLPIHAVVVALTYYWNLLLEYYFPTRPRSVIVSQKNEKTAEGDEAQEQEVVNRWIAEGKVQKLSFSWCNTLLKWSIDAIFGTLWKAALKKTLDIVFHGAPKAPNPPITITASTFILLICVVWLSQFLRLSYVVSFIGFVTVPAPQRPVFEYGAHAAIDIFFVSASKIIFPKLIKSQIVQRILVNLTEVQWRYIQSNGGAGPGRLMDEL